MDIVRINHSVLLSGSVIVLRLEPKRLERGAEVNTWRPTAADYVNILWSKLVAHVTPS
jgi:hypothetical protein